LLGAGLCRNLVDPVSPTHIDHRTNPAAWATALGISREAIDIYLSSDVIDLHVDTFIWTRIFGYDPRKRHGQGLLRGRLFSQVDLPRLREAQVSGAMWSITTWPFRTAAGRAGAFAANLGRFRRIIESVPAEAVIVCDAAGYRAARAAGRHAVFMAIQGGNALGDHPEVLLARHADTIVRVTVAHLSRSAFSGSSASRFGAGNDGLSPQGRDFVFALNQHRVFVDLAHISSRGFADAVAVHDHTQPLLVTHTGVNAVHRCWRNLDDHQLRQVADTGGVIGVVFHSLYLTGTLWGRAYARDVARHIAHVVRVVGEDHAAIGSDFDGLIVPPTDLRSCLELPRLVQELLDCGISEQVIPKILGGNFLRALAQLRG